MRVPAVCLVVLLFLASSLSSAPTKSPPVVIELFTSEGCSSCPPADRLLAKLQAEHSINGTELILLGEHVDYWNELGWHDRFSQHAFTERQSAYMQTMRGSSAYTPQAIVNGTTDVLGNDEAALRHAIGAGKRDAKATDVNLQWVGRSLQVTVKGSTATTEVLLFVTEDDLTTVVRAGENNGSTLHHAAVVRELRVLGETRGGDWQKLIHVEQSPQWQTNKLRFVVIAQQQHGTGAVVGAAAIAAPDQPTLEEASASR